MKSSGERFICYVLCRGKGPVGLSRLAEQLRDLSPRFYATLELLDLPYIEGSGFSFALGGVPFSCITVPTALPRTEWEVGARANVAWPDAARAIADHDTHIIVSPIGEPADGRAALKQAYVTTLAAAALAQSVQASGVCSTPAHTLIEPHAFVALARAMDGEPDLGALPLDAWMRLEFGRMEGRYAAIARGLRPLIGSDLGILADAPDPAGQGAVLYDTVGYLIREQRTLADGDTLDTAWGRMRAQVSGDSAMMWLVPGEGA